MNPPRLRKRQSSEPTVDPVEWDAFWQRQAAHSRMLATRKAQRQKQLIKEAVREVLIEEGLISDATDT